MRPPLLLLLLLATAARGDEPALLWSEPGPPDAIHLVFVSDGFGAAERPAFERSVRAQVGVLERHPASFVRAERARFRVHAVLVPSRATCPSRPGAAPRTPLGLRARARDGLLETDDAAVDRAARLAPGADAVVVVGRFDRPGAIPTADVPAQGARVRLPEGAEETILHELGHALFSLGDEYVLHGEPLPADEAPTLAFYPNLTTLRGGPRLGGARGLEGAAGFARGVHRAEATCVMREPGAGRFCRACAAVIAAGLRAGPTPVALALDGRTARLSPGRSDELTVLVAGDDAEGRRERLARRTRAFASDEPLDPGVFAVEGHVTAVDVGRLAPGTTLVAWRGRLGRWSAPAVARAGGVGLAGALR